MAKSMTAISSDRRASARLPLPVNVRVTNLDNGKSLIVRVNDRGPYRPRPHHRSVQRAAELLDVVQTGTARVRVTYLGRADLEGGAPPPETPPAIAAALPAAPSGKVDTAALGVVPGARGGAAGRGSHPCRRPRRFRAAMLCRYPADGAGDPSSGVRRRPISMFRLGAFSKLDNARALLVETGRRFADIHPSTERPDPL